MEKTRVSKLKATRYILRGEIRGDDSPCGQERERVCVIPSEVTNFLDRFYAELFASMRCFLTGSGQLQREERCLIRSILPLEGEATCQAITTMHRIIYVVWSTGLEACLFKNCEAVTLGVVCLHPAFESKGRIGRVPLTGLRDSFRIFLLEFLLFPYGQDSIVDDAARTTLTSKFVVTLGSSRFICTGQQGTRNKI